MFADELSTVPLCHELNPLGIAITYSGVLLVTCYKSHSLFAVYPDSGSIERVAGVGQWLSSTSGNSAGAALEVALQYPVGVVVMDDERCVYVAESSNGCIRRIDLPEHVFTERYPPALHTHTAYDVAPPAAAAAATIPEPQPHVPTAPPAPNPIDIVTQRPILPRLEGSWAEHWRSLSPVK